MLLLLFLAGSALFPKKIKQSTVRPRSVCVHACQILRSFSTLLKWSLLFSVSFCLTLFCCYYQNFEHIHTRTQIRVYFQLDRNADRSNLSNHRSIYGVSFSSHNFFSHASQILSLETDVNTSH